MGSVRSRTTQAVSGDTSPGVVLFSSSHPCFQVKLAFSSSFLSSLFSHYILYLQYLQSLTPSIFCCCAPFSCDSFQISLNAVLPSHSWSSLPPFFLRLLASDLCQFFISHSFHMTGPFQPTPHQFPLKTFLHSNLLCQFMYSSLISLLFSPTILIQLFLPTCTSCYFSVSAIVPKPHMYIIVLFSTWRNYIKVKVWTSERS